jgi:hypothetical protein
LKQSRFKTLAIDSGSELARLCFAWDMKATPAELEKVRGMTNYPGAGERLNKIMRRLRVARDEFGMECVVLCHEGIDKLYGRGSVMAKNAAEREPYAVKGRIDIPGSQTPEELMRVADNVIRVRHLNGKPIWALVPEPIGGSTSAEHWEAKTRFDPQPLGFPEPSYTKLREKMTALKMPYYGPFIWMLYGGIGKQKTRSLLTFPRPIRIFDVDSGTAVIRPEVEKDPENFHITKYNSEYFPDYERFMLDLEEALGGEAVDLQRVKSELAKRKEPRE